MAKLEGTDEVWGMDRTERNATAIDRMGLMVGHLGERDTELDPFLSRRNGWSDDDNLPTENDW
jgi:hypothetical protein